MKNNNGLRNILIAFGLAFTIAIGTALLANILTGRGKILDYAQCEKAGGTTSMTRPRVCTKDGEQYVNSADKQNCYRSGYISNSRLCR